MPRTSGARLETSVLVVIAFTITICTFLCLGTVVLLRLFSESNISQESHASAPRLSVMESSDQPTPATAHAVVVNTQQCPASPNQVGQVDY